MMKTKKDRVICIVGPTASGKTALSIQLAKAMNTEIISADSVQIFKGMDIGSAKPSIAERDGVVHHLIDRLEIDEAGYSVSMFRDLAVPIIRGLNEDGKVPLIVGGSGLYVSAIINPLDFAIPSNPMIRKKIEASYQEDPNRAYEELRSVDPTTAMRVHLNDKKRVVRALEVYHCCGKPLSSFGNDFQNEAQKPSPYDALQIGIRMERPLLYERINLRVNQMLQNGLLEEAEHIYRMGYDRRLPAMLSIGYRQLFLYFDGLCTLDEAIALIKQETRRFAKRQMTWFGRDTRIHWLNSSGTNAEVMLQESLQLCERFLREDYDANFNQ